MPLSSRNNSAKTERSRNRLTRRSIFVFKLFYKFEMFNEWVVCSRNFASKGGEPGAVS